MQVTTTLSASTQDTQEIENKTPKFTLISTPKKEKKLLQIEIKIVKY